MSVPMDPLWPAEKRRVDARIPLGDGTRIDGVYQHGQQRISGGVHPLIYASRPWHTIGVGL